MSKHQAVDSETPSRTEVSSVRICVLEDNYSLRESLTDVLVDSGYTVEGFSSAEDLAESSFMFSAHLLIADLNLPGEDGLSVVRRLKQVLPELKVIMMTTRTSVDDRVAGYDSGADIYLPKPVDLNELLATVRALTRQSSANERPESAGTLFLNSLWLECPTGHTYLTQTEVDILCALTGAYGQKLEYWQLLEVMGLDIDDAAKAKLAVRMTRLRHKLSKIGLEHDVLHAVRGEGYQLTIRLELKTKPFHS